MIAVDDLTFRYPGARQPAVRGVSFAVEAGEIFGFLGPSGAGKSTIQKILIRLLTEYTGEVAVLGRPLPDWGRELYEQVGVSFELPYHYLKLTGLENLRYFRSLYRGETEEPRRLLEQVGLGGEGDKRVERYSKGMRVRLSVARALLQRPRLLFLDEPTAGLDPGTSRLVRSLIRQQREAGVTVFLTTHDMTVADELCDRVAFLVDGRIALVDAPRDLKLAHGERRVRIELAPSGGPTTGPGHAPERLELPLAGIADDPRFQAALRRPELETIHTLETTLEEVFLRVTGHSLTGHSLTGAEASGDAPERQPLGEDRPPREGTD